MNKNTKSLITFFSIFIFSIVLIIVFKNIKNNLEVKKNQIKFLEKNLDNKKSQLANIHTKLLKKNVNIENIFQLKQNEVRDENIPRDETTPFTLSTRP